MDNWDCQVRRDPTCNRGIAAGVGGFEAFPTEFPAMISLQNEYGKHVCGGTILSAYVVLTAAHCVFNWNLKSIRVVAGAHNVKIRERTQQMRRLVKIITHPNYNPGTYENDIAVLKLESPLFFGNAVQPIILGNSERKDYSFATLVGWGRTSFTSTKNDTTILQQVYMLTVPETVCQEKYGDIKVQNSMICAGTDGKDACLGDSGGPLLCYGPCGSEEQCGIVSFGIECGNPLFPGVYTKIQSFIPWLIQQRVICPSDQFMCHAGSRYGTCISKRFRCDGTKNCYDGEDEDYAKCLKTTEAMACPLTSSMCDYKINDGGKCVPHFAFCDGYASCKDGKDEQCSGNTRESAIFLTLEETLDYEPCPCFLFQCRNNVTYLTTSCISKELLCDGVRDCEYGDDEEENNCQRYQPSQDYDFKNRMLT